MAGDWWGRGRCDWPRGSRDSGKPGSWQFGARSSVGWWCALGVDGGVQCVLAMAIPFHLPSDEETEDNYRRLDQLLLDLYHVLRQILLRPSCVPGAPAG